MQRDDPEHDDEAWRSIVDNYGDRAELEDDPTPPPPTPRAPRAPWAADDELLAGPPSYDARERETEPDLDPDRFVPPDPPLPPRPSRDRLAAWIGVLGAPVVLLVLVLIGLGIPTLLGYALVAAFIGGFLYLAFRLPRTPEDPWDDGARL